MQNGVDRKVASTLEGRDRLDLAGLLRSDGRKHEVDVLAVWRLSGDLAAEGALQALGAVFALAQLQQAGSPLRRLYRLVDMLGDDQTAARGLPALVGGGQHAIAPSAARHQRHDPTHAIAPGPADHCVRSVLGGETELEQLCRAFLAVVTVVECEGSDR